VLGKVVIMFSSSTQRMKIHLPLFPMLLTLLCLPACAEIDLAGSWASVSQGDDVLLLADYTGIPYNEAGRAKALSYSQSQMSVPERVCLFYTQAQLFGGPFGLRISNETAPDGKVVAWTLAGWEDRAPMTIWMDGRPHPSDHAPHERTGFTTGRWEGNVLVSYTTHMKTGFIRRNGAQHSDQATLTIHFLRHGELLTLAATLDDPIYLSAPLYWSRSFRQTRGQVEQLAGPCIQGDEGVAEGVVPHYLPGQNPFIDEMNKSFHVPVVASQGGAETMYPEFRNKIKDGFVIIDKCTRCGGLGPGPRR